MHELALPNLKKYIGGNWELVLFEGEVDNAQQMFRDVFIKTHRLWHEQPCNILFVDLDVLAVASVDFFDQYNDFRMFAQIEDQSYNCGLRYFPHTMDPAVWDIGLELYRDWDEDSEWDREQRIYSKMLCSQADFVFKQVPMNVWFHTLEFDPDHFDQYKLLHFHSAKGPKPVYALMKKYLAELEKQQQNTSPTVVV